MTDGRVKRKERNKFIAFYVSDEEKEYIANQAAINDMTISDYCRKVLLRSNMKPEN